MTKNLIQSLDKVLNINKHSEEEDALWKVYLPAFLQVDGLIRLSMEKFFSDNNFSVCSPSVLVGVLGACENFDTVYKIKKVNQGHEFLSQTAQLQLERLLSFPFEKVACITRSFRNEENVDDGRHLKEFTLVEMEMAGCELNDLLNTIDNFVKHIAKDVFDGRNAQILENIFGIDIERKRKQFLHVCFPRVSYDDAIESLRNNGMNIEWGDDLTREYEQELIRLHGGIPIFVTHFPSRIKFFNMRVNRGNQKIVNSADLLLPISGEAVGSAEREYDYEILLSRFKDSQMYRKMLLAGIDEKDLGCYFKIVEKGQMPKHAGFGMGLERLLQSMLSSKETDIRLFSQSYILNRLLGIV